MRVVEEFVTSAHVETVWQVLADVEHWRDWTSTVTEIKPLNSSGLKVGARYRVVQPKLIPAIYEVTECIPNQTFTWIRKFPGGGMVADHRLLSHDDITEVEVSITSKGLLANIAFKIFSRITRDYVAAEARSLKERCDTLALQQKSTSRSTTCSSIGQFISG